jgi:hypothetical protein
VSRLLAILLAGLIYAAPLGHAAAPPRVPDTGGIHLMKVWRMVRRHYRDALLISISGRTLPTGIPLCSPQSPFQNGWRYTFYSPSKDKFLMMAACRGRVSPKPLVQMRDEGTPKFDIQGKFVDSDVALKKLAESGVDLDPRTYKAGGRRPFNLKLFRLEDSKFKTHPTVWQLKIGGKRFLIDAVKNKPFSPRDYGVSYDVKFSTAADFESEVLARRPKKKNVYTVRKDFEKILRYGAEKFPGSSLMAIEGFVDAWGGSPCNGPGDGWAFYFYYPRSRNFEPVYACNGHIGPGPMGYIPVDFNIHKPLSKEFLDSSHIISSLLIHHPDAMNKAMGGLFKRQGSFLIRNYKASPFKNTDFWKVTQIAEVRMGRTRFRFDGRNARLLDVVE